MSGAHFQINQAANTVPTGTTDIARNDVWQDQTVIFHRTDTATAGPSFSLTAGPAGQSLTLTNPLTNDASMSNPKPGAYIADLIVGDGLGANHLRMIFRVTRTATGLVIDNGICEPCFGETVGDDNSASNLQGYAAIVANSTKGVTPTVTTLVGLRSITSLRVTKVFVNSVDGGVFRWNATNNNTTNPDDGWRYLVPTGLTTGCWERAVLAAIPTSGPNAATVQIGDAATDTTVAGNLNVNVNGFVAGTVFTNSVAATGTVQTVNLTATALHLGVVHSSAGGGFSSSTVVDADISGAIGLAHGGTGATALASGVVHSNGTVLSSSPVVLTSEVSGILPVANGGSGVNALVSGVIHSNGTVLSSSSVVNTDVAAGIAGSKIVPAFGTQDLSATGTNVLASDNATHVPLTAKSFAAQSASIQDWSTSTPTVLASMTKDGFLQVADGAVGTPSLGFLSDPNTGIYHVTADDVALVTNGVKRFQVNNTGLGFNATAPVAKPTVSGQLTGLGSTGALKSLLTALSNYGLVTDSSTDPLNGFLPVTFKGTATTTDAATQQTAITIDMTALGGTNYGYGIKVWAVYSSPGLYGGTAEWFAGGSRQGATISTTTKSDNSDATNGVAGDGVFAQPPITISVSTTNLLVRLRGIASTTINWTVRAEIVVL